MNEREMLSQLFNPFIINLCELFQDGDSLYMAMDYLKGGDLRYHICYRQGFTEAETSTNPLNAEFLIANMVLGLEYLRAKNIVHRDIKPENIVFEETGYARITDLGISKYHGAEENLKAEPSGTPGYMAPEVLNKRLSSFEADYFALGVIVYELMMGRRPYEGKDRAEIKAKIQSQPIHLTP